MEHKTLKAQGLVKAYGKKQVLHGINIEFRPGCIYGLIGRNGAGKTTLLGCLTGQLRPTGGQVLYGEDLVWENAKALENICFSREMSTTFFAGPNTYKIRDYMRAARAYYPGWDEEYAQKLVAEFGLNVKKQISKLSKGMLSMVTIVLALASRAPVTILDEPVAGLDVVARQRFYDLLLEDFEQTGRTFVVSTHILDEASPIFEEVVVLDEGNIIAMDNTDHLLSVLHQVSGLEDEVDAAVEGMELISSRRTGRSKTVVVRCEESLLQRAVAGRPVDASRLNLQNAFIALTGHKEDSHDQK